MIPHNGVAVNILYICNIYLTLECTLLTRYKDTNLYIKNIKLHIVTDIKVLHLNIICLDVAATKQNKTIK